MSVPSPSGAQVEPAGAAGPGLRRTLSVWQAVGLSVALMAPSMAANINPQGTAGTVGRAVPLAFLLAAVGVLLVAYGFVRLTQYFQNAGSVYAFVGATLGARTGLVSGLGLLGTYCFYGVVTSTASGIFGIDFLRSVGVWPNPPPWAPFVVAAVALLGALALTVVPARRGTSVLLTVEGATVGLILVISAIVLVRLLTGGAPGGQDFTLSVFTVPEGTGWSALFLGVVFGFLSFAGFEAAATLGEEARHPRRDIPRAILGTAVFGGVYFVVVTAVEVMGFGTDDAGVARFVASGSLLGDLGRAYIAGWVGDLITIGAAISAFGCCLACMVGASRLAFAFARDLRREGTPPTGLAGTTRAGTPGPAALLVLGVMALVMAVTAIAGGGEPFEVFLWSGTIGTLVLLVAYVLTTVGAINLVFVERRLPGVPMWQVVVPVLALVVLGYTLYRNVVPLPSPADGALFWNPVVAAAWLAACVVAVLVAPAAALRAGAALTAAELGTREGVGAR